MHRAKCVVWCGIGRCNSVGVAGTWQRRWLYKVIVQNTRYGDSEIEREPAYYVQNARDEEGDEQFQRCHPGQNEPLEKAEEKYLKRCVRCRIEHWELLLRDCLFESLGVKLPSWILCFQVHVV